MNVKSKLTDYKFYGILIGVILATIIYNIVPLDLYFDTNIIEKNISFGQYLIFIFTTNLKKYLLILLISFIGKRREILSLIICYYSFKMAANMVVAFRFAKWLYITGVIENAIIIGLIIIMLKKGSIRKNRIIGLLYILLCSIFENFFISFFM